MSRSIVKWDLKNININKFSVIFVVSVIAAGIIILVYVFHIFSSINYPDNNIKIIHYADHISAAHQELIDIFNEEHKGKIRVETVNLPFEKFSTNERKELLVRFFRNKNDRIDVFSVDQIWVPRFQGWGIPLDSLISDTTRDNIIKYALESCIYNNKFVAVPLYIDISLMYYRDDLLRKLKNYKEIVQKLSNSITWQDFIELHKKFNNKKNPFYIMQAENYEGLVCQFVEMVRGLKGYLINGNKINLNTKEARRALQLLVDFVNKYRISPKDVLYFKEITSYKYFIKNNGVFLRSWPGFLKDYKTYINNPKIYNNLRRAPVPHFKGYNPASVFGGWNLMISKFSKNKKEALEFIKFLLKAESQKILYTDGGYIPINNKVYQDSAFLDKNPELKFYSRLLKTGVHRPFLENYTIISDILSHYINIAIRKELTVQEALSKAQEEINSKNILNE